MARLVVDKVFMQFGDAAHNGVVALRDISLTVEDREFCVIVGPSGCGKSTLLRLAAGLSRPTEGRLLLDGTEIQGPSRQRGMVFQSYTLFPWLTVRGNIEFGPRLKGTPVDRTVEDGDVIDEVMGGLQVIATPGHSPGQVAFYQPERKILFTGDTMMNAFSFNGLRLPFAVATPDMDEAKRSIRKVAQLDIEIACFGHGQPLTQDAAAQIRAFASTI